MIAVGAFVCVLEEGVLLNNSTLLSKFCGESSQKEDNMQCVCVCVGVCAGERSAMLEGEDLNGIFFVCVNYEEVQ